MGHNPGGGAAGERERARAVPACLVPAVITVHASIEQPVVKQRAWEIPFRGAGYGVARFGHRE